MTTPPTTPTPPTLYATVHMAELLDTLTPPQVAGMDFDRTRAHLAGLLGEELRQATGYPAVVEVHFDSGLDHWHLAPLDGPEPHWLAVTVSDTLMDFGWWDTGRWMIKRGAV